MIRMIKKVNYFLVVNTLIQLSINYNCYLKFFYTSNKIKDMTCPSSERFSKNANFQQIQIQTKILIIYYIIYVYKFNYIAVKTTIIIIIFLNNH